MIAACAAVSPVASQLPSNRQVLTFVTQTIDWYHHRSVERQIATEPADVIFVEDNRPVAAQIVQLSFDFARADASAASILPAHNQEEPGSTSTSSPASAQFVHMQQDVERESLEANQQIDETQKRLLSARGAERRRLRAQLDATQSRLEVLRAASATLKQLIEFVRELGGRNSGDLMSSVEDLARTVPDVSNPNPTASQTQGPAVASAAKRHDSGILGLSSEVSALAQKLHILDEEILETDKLRKSEDDLRSPLLASIAERFSKDTASTLQAGDLSVLQQQKARLDELAVLVKAVSPAIVALDKQRVLLDTYTSHLKSWRAAVVSDNAKAWKSLMLRLAGVIMLLGGLAIIGGVTRKAIRAHVHDAERRHVMLVIRRVVLWFTVLVVAALAITSDLASLATFFGLLTAGVAVALQSVIMAAVGYFVLVGSRGIRIGDRVQISGVTGDVVEMGWLQFQLKEIDSQTQQPTGNVVTFANSFVLAAPAAGLSKLNRQDLTKAQTEAAARASAQATTG